MALSCIICQIKRDIGRKSWLFHTPLHSTPPLGRFPSEYCHPVWCGITRMVGLSDGEKILRICVTVYTQYRRVMDGQTDRQTSCHGIVRAMHTRHAVKMRQFWQAVVSRHFRRGYLKANKVSKSEGTMKVEYTYHFRKWANVVYPQLSKSVCACQNYSLPKLARFLRHSV